MDTIPDTIRLTAEQRTMMAEIVRQSGRPWDVLLSQALGSLKTSALPPIGSGESVRDAMVRLGLLGCIKNAPADLSTNPACLVDDR